MNIHGYEVPADVLAALVERVKQEPFRTSHLASIACALGVPSEIKYSHTSLCEPCASELAIRLTQHHRKRGDIVREGRNWIWRGV